MKVLKRRTSNKRIPKEAFEKALGVKVESWYLLDDCLKLYTKTHVFYLLCEDVKALLKMKENIFSYNLKLNKEDISWSEDDEEEIFRGKVKKWKKSLLN